jgi:heat shock protein HtpX
MSNVIKTAILLALLTAMLVLLGGAVGGRQGMLVAFFIALVMNFVSYWWSDKIVLRMYGAQPIEEAQAPGLYAMVHRLASKAGIPMRSAERVRDRPQPGARGGGRHRGDHADPRRRRARGRAGPRDFPCHQP